MKIQFRFALAVLLPLCLSAQQPPPNGILYVPTCGVGCHDQVELGRVSLITFDGVAISAEYAPHLDFTSQEHVFEDFIVLYIDSREGGFENNMAFTDFGGGSLDPVRASISGYNGNFKTFITFPPGFLADFAVVFSPHAMAANGVYELQASAPHTFVDAITLTPDNQADPSIYFFEFDYAEVDAQTGVKFVGTHVDPLAGSMVEISRNTFGLSSRNCMFGCNTTFHTYNLFEARTRLTGSAGWRLLSFPESCAYPHSAQLALFDLWTSGAGGSDDVDGAPNMFRSVGSSGPNVNLTPVTNLTCFMPSPHGAVAMKVNGDDNGGPGPGTWPKTIRLISDDMLRGEMLSWPIAIHEWTSGTEWMLLGNPYAATIDWDQVIFGADMGTPVWLWNNATQTYDTYNQGNGNVIDGLIAPFEGFWLRYDGPANEIHIPHTAQTTGGIFRGKEADEIRLVVRVSDAEGSNTTWVAFNGDASPGPDRFDAEKLTPLSDSYVQIYTVVGGVAHDINVQPLTAPGFLQTDLGISSTRGGAQTLDFAEFQMPDDWAAYLFDKQTQQTHLLNASFSLPLTSSLSKAAPLNERPMVLAATAPRFTLIIDPGTSTSVDRGPETVDRMALHGAYPNPFNPSTVIGFTLDAPRATRLAVYDMLGRQVATLIDGQMPAGEHKATFDASNLTSGVYIVRLEAGGTSMTRRVTLLK